VQIKFKEHLLLFLQNGKNTVKPQLYSLAMSEWTT